MNFYAVLFSHFYSEYEAFSLLANLINTPLIYASFTANTKVLKKYSKILQTIIQHILPNLFSKLKKIEFQFHLYLFESIISLFAYSFDLEFICKIWNIILSDAEFEILIMCTTIMKALENKLVENADIVFCMFKHPLQYCEKDDIMKAYEDISKKFPYLKQKITKK
jgi:hypothetical protein